MKRLGTPGISSLGHIASLSFLLYFAVLRCKRYRLLGPEKTFRCRPSTDAERKACEVRLRAEIRTGELLKELSRAQGERTDLTSPRDGDKLPSPYAQALADNNISTQSASRYQALADVPKPIIEQAFLDPVVKPTTRGLIEAVRRVSYK